MPLSDAEDVVVRVVEREDQLHHLSVEDGVEAEEAANTQ